MAGIFAKQALLPEGWRDDVRIEIADGYISAVSIGQMPAPGDIRCEALAPGMPNLHSHAFQRGMAGLAEIRGDSADSFWSWRDTMYRFALSMTPDQMEAVAAQLYVEMLEAGFSRVGEFHYLHHDLDGRPYGNIAELAGRIVAAAETSGIRLTLLPVFYAHSTFGGASPTSGQRRFINDINQFSAIVEKCRESVRILNQAVVGIAPHSLRAVTESELRELLPLAEGGPIHIHIAEQTKEVDDCVAFSGQRPVEWLMEHAPVDQRWCLIHATHMLPAEVEAVARSGAVAGLCPLTEANLGDGTFEADAFLRNGGVFGIGSDSNVQIGVGDELRQLEYSQRLARRERNVIASTGSSTGATLFTGALKGGARALALAPGGIATGAAADLVSLDLSHPGTEGLRGDAILDTWIFTGRIKPNTVWINGEVMVSGGRHRKRDEVASRFRDAIRALVA